MATVKRVGPGSAFKIGFVMYGILGLVIGIFVAFISMVAGPLGPFGQTAVPGAKLMGFGMGIGAVIFFPVCYGIVGGIGGAFSAVMYNVVAGWVGGLEVDIS